MTDKEIINGLIAHDNRITEEFFFVSCRPLFLSIMKLVFNCEVDYNEMVNELYVYLMEDNASKLRNFQYRSSVYQWLKILSIRFFIKIRTQLIDGNDKDTPYDEGEQMEHNSAKTAEYDLERLFENMSTKRYVYVIRKLILEDYEPNDIAHELKITTANLYNIKRRAIAQLTRVALNDIMEYEK